MVEMLKESLYQSYSWGH